MTYIPKAPGQLEKLLPIFAGLCDNTFMQQKQCIGWCHTEQSCAVACMTGVSHLTPGYQETYDITVDTLWRFKQEVGELNARGEISKYRPTPDGQSACFVSSSDQQTQHY